MTSMLEEKTSLSKSQEEGELGDAELEGKDVATLQRVRVDQAVMRA